MAYKNALDQEMEIGHVFSPPDLSTNTAVPTASNSEKKWGAIRLQLR